LQLINHQPNFVGTSLNVINLDFQVFKNLHVVGKHLKLWLIMFKSVV